MNDLLTYQINTSQVALNIKVSLNATQRLKSCMRLRRGRRRKGRADRMVDGSNGSRAYSQESYSKKLFKLRLERVDRRKCRMGTNRFDSCRFGN